MKKSMLTFGLLLSFVVLTFAQVNDRSFFINANSSGIKFASRSVEVENSNQEAEERVFEMDVALGYSFVENLVVGVAMNIDSEEINDAEFNRFAVGPMARYYFPVGDFKPFAETAILFGNVENGNQDNSLFLFRIHAGGEYFITDGFSIGGKLGIGFGNSESENYNVDSSIFEFTFGVGFSFFI